MLRSITACHRKREAFAKQVAEKLLAAMKVKGAPEAGPGAEQRVEQAVTGIAKGASEGDEQLQQALSLLAARNAAQATPLLKAVADNKAARIQKDRKERRPPIATSAPSPVCAIPRGALDAYTKAAELDPDDAESLFWAGWLEVDHGELSSAEARLRRVLSLTAEQDWRQYWAQVGLADIKIKRGDLPGALKSYRDSLAIAERLAKADPGNAGWQPWLLNNQVPLSLSHGFPPSSLRPDWNWKCRKVGAPSVHNHMHRTGLG